MDLSEIGNGIIAFVTDNPIVAVVAGFLILLMLFRKTKLFLLILFLAFVLAAALYIITDVASVGKAGKGKIIQQGVQPGADEKN